MYANAQVCFETLGATYVTSLNRIQVIARYSQPCPVELVPQFSTGLWRIWLTTVRYIETYLQVGKSGIRGAFHAQNRGVM